MDATQFKFIVVIDISYYRLSFDLPFSTDFFMDDVIIAINIIMYNLIDNFMDTIITNLMSVTLISIMVYYNLFTFPVLQINYE